MFLASGVIFVVVPVLQEKNISVNTKCDFVIKIIWMLTVHYDFQAWNKDKNVNIQKQTVLNLFFFSFAV